MSGGILVKYAHCYAGLETLNALSAENAAGAYLLEGEDSDGLSVLARLVAARIAGIPDSKAFDDTADIMTYPVPPEKKSAKGKKSDDGKKPVMSVEDVREIINSLYLTPFELAKRFYIIENAETMSEVCQNKLLKSLEEPPARVCFILCATKAMLPTVESRCRTLRLPPFPIAMVEEELNKRHKDRAAVALAARASRGNLGLAERILADKDFGAMYAAALKIIKLAIGSKMFGSVSAVYDKFNREKADTVLGIIEYLLGDIARMLSGLDTVFDSADVRAVSAGFTPYSAARCAELVRVFKRRNESNCMVSAVMDEFVLKLMEEKSLCQR